MPYEVNIRYSQKVRDQLIWLKRQTGLQHYHTLCRWGLCLSLQDPSPAREYQQGGDSIERQTQGDGAEALHEISWMRLAQEYTPILELMIRKRLLDEGGEDTQPAFQAMVQAHVQRGLSRLMAGKKIRSIEDLISIALQEQEQSHEKTTA